MDYTQDKQKSALSQLEWSSAYFTVSEFLKKFTLPQLAKVAGGFYGEDDESTLIGNQILCLHSIKPMEKVRGREGSGREISILVECKNKVIVRPINSKDVYETVEELCTAFPRYVRVSQGYYSPSKDEEIIKVGDKLHLKSIDKSKKGKEKLICVNQNGQTIELPKDCTAGFQPLTDGKEYYLSEVVKKFSMPVYVQFVDSIGLSEETLSEDKSFCEPLGTICLQRAFTETVVTATSIRDDGRQNIVTFSPGVDINLIVCEDMLRDSTDYAELCQSFSQDIDFQSISPDIYEYLDVAQTMKEVPLDVSRRISSSKKPYLKKPSKKSSTSKHDTKIGAKLTGFLRRHSERKTSSTSKTVQNDKTEETQPIYADPNNIYDDIEPKSTECKKETIYTELDPTYISTTSHEYEKPLTHSSATGKLSPISPSNRPDDSGSNSHSYGSRNPPPVQKKPSSRPKNSTASSDSPPAVPTRPQIPDTPPQLLKRPPAPDKKPTAPDKKPAVPKKKPAAPHKKPAAPDNKPARPDRKTATPDQLHLVSESPTTHDSKTVSPTSPPQLPYRSKVPDNMRASPISPSKKPPPFHISKKPAITPGRQKDEIDEAIAKFPSDLSSLSVADVCTLLKYLGMESDVEIFQAELVDGEMLASMDRESLESLNISAFHVKKLLKFIGGWRPNVQ